MHAFAFFHIALLLCDRWVRQESHSMQASEQLIRLKPLVLVHQCNLTAHGSVSLWILLPYPLFGCIIILYFFVWCFLDNIYCISLYISTLLMNSAAPYFCQHCLISHKCTKSVCPVVGVESCRNHFGCSLQRNSSGWSQWSPCTLLFHYIPSFSGSLTVYHSWTVRLRMTCSHMAQVTEHGSWRCSSAL